jgi:hypothetical protein
MKKTDIKKVKAGESATLSKSMKQFYKEKAYEFNTIGGASTGMMRQDTAETTFFAWMLLGNNYPHKIKILQSLPEVGDGPGFRVLIKFPCGLEHRTLFSYRDLTRRKK